MHVSAQKVADAAQALGLDIEILEFEQTTRSAQEAADTIGCDVAQIVKSLCFEINGRSVICLVSGTNQLDERKLAALAGVGRKKVKRANAETVKATTGFSIGGVPPFGHVTAVPIYIDADLMQFDEVWAAAGTPFAVFACTPRNLAQITQGEIANIKK